MKTIREYIDLIESAQNLAEAYTPSAGELARDLIKMPDSDFNKKYGMSKQQANHYYSSSKLKEQGVAEGTDELAKLKKKYQSYLNSDLAPAQKEEVLRRIRKEIELINSKQGMAEDQATRTCPQCDGSGEDTLDPTKSCRRCGGKGHIPVPKEQDIEEDQATAQMGLMSAMGSNDNNPADQRRAMAQQAVERLATKR